MDNDIKKNFDEVLKKRGINKSDILAGGIASFWIEGNDYIKTLFDKPELEQDIINACLTLSIESQERYIDDIQGDGLDERRNLLAQKCRHALENKNIVYEIIDEKDDE